MQWTRCIAVCSHQVTNVLVFTSKSCHRVATRYIKTSNAAISSCHKNFETAACCRAEGKAAMKVAAISTLRQHCLSRLLTWVALFHSFEDLLSSPCRFGGKSSQKGLQHIHFRVNLPLTTSSQFDLNHILRKAKTRQRQLFPDQIRYTRNSSQIEGSWRQRQAQKQVEPSVESGQNKCLLAKTSWTGIRNHFDYSSIRIGCESSTATEPSSAKSDFYLLHRYRNPLSLSRKSG